VTVRPLALEYERSEIVWASLMLTPDELITGRTPGWLLTGLLGGLILGIVGMHGLTNGPMANDHGAGHQPQAVVENIGHDLLAPTAATGAAAQQTATPDPLSSDGHGALALCLVMLVGLGLMVLTALRGRPRAVALAPRLGLDRRPRPGRGLRAPPLLSELSILRC